jgi:hypothetical protein
MIAWQPIIGLSLSVPVGRGTWCSTEGQRLNPHIPGAVVCDCYLWSLGPVRKIPRPVQERWEAMKALCAQ